MKIISLTAPKGSGKSEVANIIASKHPDIVRLSFAQPLKLACSQVFGIDLKHFMEPELKEKKLYAPIPLSTEAHLKPLLELYASSMYYVWAHSSVAMKALNGVSLSTPRDILQIVGTNFLRTLDDQVHLNKFKKELEQHKNKIVVIDDCRFLNEFEVLQALGAMCFLVSRPGHKVIGTHSSESEYLKFAGELTLIENNGTLEDLEQEVLRKVKF